MTTTRLGRHGWLSGLFLVGILTLPACASAQDTGTRTPVPHNQILSVNPFLLLAEWVNIDYERRVNDKSSLGIVGSWISPDDAEGVSAALVWRYYPQEAALSGFYIGPRVALYHGTDDDDDAEGTAGGVGVELGYNWLFGAERNFSVSTGFGLTRVWGDVDTVIPSIRLVNVGIAF